MKLYFLVSGGFGERVIGNITNLPRFCKVCGATCDFCRAKYRSVSSDIVGVDMIPSNIPSFLDNPEDYLPTNPPKADVILAVGIHLDILSALPRLVEKGGAKGVIVPVEDVGWCPQKIQSNLEKELTDMKVESVFPRPFCALEESGSQVIDRFVREYRIGRPRFEIKVKDDLILDVDVVRSAPCGSSWFTAHELKSMRITDDLDRVVWRSHRGYPCTASMHIDPETGEPFLNKSGQLVVEAVHDAVSAAKNLKDTPLITTSESSPC